jgi:hypothetical protein
VSISGDGLSVFSCGQDGAVKHWDMSGEMEIGRYHHPILRHTHLEAATQAKSLQCAAVPSALLPVHVIATGVNKQLLIVPAGNIGTLSQVHKSKLYHALF